MMKIKQGKVIFEVFPFQFAQYLKFQCSFFCWFYYGRNQIRYFLLPFNAVYLYMIVFKIIYLELEKLRKL